MGEDEQRGFNPAVQFVNSKVHGKYWKIDVPVLTDEGYDSGCDDAVTSYYSRGPTVVAGSSFGRNTRGFPATRDVDRIDKPNVFVKTAWQHAERGPNSTRLSELDCLKLIKKEFGNGKDGIHVPILVAGGVMAKRRSDGSLVPLTTDAFYVGDILKRHRIVENSETIGDGVAPQPGLSGANDEERNPLLEPRLIAFRQQYVLVTEKICEPLNTIHKGNEVPLEISEWHTSNSMVAIAVKKRKHLHDVQSFTDDISDRFPISSEDSKIPDYRALNDLAVDLYRAMFQNPGVDEKCRGARKRKDDGVLSKRSMYRFGSSKDGGPLSSFKNMTMEPSGTEDILTKPTSNDPFVNRAEHSAKTKIIESLKEVLTYHADFAKETLATVSSK
ncbi:hypothetical protein GGI01_003716 [Coemansia sp. RSA 376]|nr:hypothetical protein GGI01_003716 [Coemansia sp. RSA 376]